MGTQLNVTEWMRGHVGFGAADYATGETQGKHDATKFEHEVLIQMTDIDVFVSEPRHSARMDGKVLWRGAWQTFEGGEFDMLVHSRSKSIQHMFYRIPFKDDDGTPMTMLGHKQITDDNGIDLPADITTLFIHIYAGDVHGHDFTKPETEIPEWPSGAVALGILHIPIRDGINSALSFDAPESSWVAKQLAVFKFVKFYGREVFKLYVLQSAPKLLGALLLTVVALLVLLR